MGTQRRLTLLDSSQQFELRFKGKTVGVIQKKFLEELLAPTVKPKPKQRRKKPKCKADDELLVKAKQLSKAYTKLKAKHHRSKVGDVMLSTSNITHLVNAVKMMQRHKITNYQVFLKAQVGGLKFVNGGVGVFPKISQLATTAAEDRLLDYLKADKDEKGDVVRVEISDEDRTTPLSANMKYAARRQRVLDGIASRNDAVYVKELQMLRRGKVQKEILDFLDNLDSENE